jgi:hypothetical protein
MIEVIIAGVLSLAFLVALNWSGILVEGETRPKQEQ